MRRMINKIKIQENTQKKAFGEEICEGQRNIGNRKAKEIGNATGKARGKCNRREESMLKYS